MSTFLNPYAFSGLSFSFFDSAWSDQLTYCAIPTGIAAGDLALYLDIENTNTLTVPSNVTPTGFTQIQTHSLSGAIGARVSSNYKLLSGSEGGTNITGIAPSGTSAKLVLVFRPSVPINSVTSNSLNGQATASTPSNQSLAMAGATTFPVIGISTYGSTGAISTRGDSSAAMTEISASTKGYAKYVIYNPGSTLASSTISMTDGGTNMMTSFYLTFT